MIEPRKRDQLEETNVFVLSVLISVLMLIAFFINRYFGTDCIGWKIAAVGLSLYAVIAPWLGKKAASFRRFFIRSTMLFFLLLADCILYLWLIPRCKFSEMNFYMEFILFPLATFLILSFIISRSVQR